MSYNRENQHPQYHLESSESHNSSKNQLEIAQNYSPFVIKKTNSLLNSEHKQNKIPSNINSPFKIYTPSPNCREHLSDRFIPCKGVNLLTKFQMTQSYQKQNNEESKKTNDINFEINIDNIDAFDLNSPQIISSSNNNNAQLNNNLISNSSSNNNNDDNPNLITTNEDLSKNKNYFSLLQKSFLNEETHSSFLNKQIISPKENKNLKSKIFSFKSDKNKKKTIFSSNDFSEMVNNFSLNKQPNARKINKAPFKILEAPNLMDDFYLNLVDWSSQNDLSVGLLNSVFVWSANKSKVSKLCEYSNETYVSSVIWNQR